MNKRSMNKITDNVFTCYEEKYVVGLYEIIGNPSAAGSLRVFDLFTMENYVSRILLVRLLSFN